MHQELENEEGEVRTEVEAWDLRKRRKKSWVQGMWDGSMPEDSDALPQINKLATRMCEKKT